MDLSSLSPQDQQSLLAMLGQQNQQTMDPSAFNVSSNNPSGPVPTPSSSPLQKQDGDQMHPTDAVSQIGQQMYGPPKPAGVELATGPELTQTKNGLVAKLPADHPILRALGIKQTYPVNEPNYFSAAQQAGVDKFLPNGLARMPDGTPFVGKTAYEQALTTQRTTVGQGKEVYDTLDKLTSQGIPADDARRLLAANPKGVTSKEVGNYYSAGRLDAMNTMADARATMAGVVKMTQLLKVGGFDAAQPAAQAAIKNLGNAERAQAAIDQIVANGGEANQRQRSELAASIAQIASNSSGVLTNERMNQFLPESAKGKFGNFVEYLTNDNTPVNFNGFLPQLQDLLLREKQANKGIADAASNLGISILATSQPKTAKTLSGIRTTSPLIGNPPPTNPAAPAIQPPPATVPNFTTPQGIRQGFQSGKITRQQATALLKAMGK